jgi:hypothetical protein
MRAKSPRTKRKTDEKSRPAANPESLEMKVASSNKDHEGQPLTHRAFSDVP